MVYVDQMNQYIGTKTIAWKRSCHLYADTLTELNNFATKLNLKKLWLKEENGRPYYDLVSSKREYAIELGAISINEYNLPNTKINNYRAQLN